jgi:hypothetical protein
MNLKMILLSVTMWAASVSVGAQNARNPLNHEPARVTLQSKSSAWKLSDETFYRADGVPFDRSSIVYDKNGRKASTLTQVRDRDEGRWQDATRKDYFYGEGNVNVVKSKTFADRWTNISKVENKLSATGNPLSSVSYTWSEENEDWALIPEFRCEWIYDRHDRVTTYMKQFSDKKTGEWLAPSIRIVYTYDQQGDLSEELFQTLNAETNAWTPQGKYVYSKEGGKQDVAQSFVFVSGEWINDGKTVYTCDNEGKIIRGDFYEAKADGVLKAFSVCTYSESVGCPEVVERGEINVYPSPVVSSFELTVPDGLTGKTMNLFDMSGRLVKSLLVKDTKMQVSIGGLTSGVYILQADDMTKKIVIK